MDSLFGFSNQISQIDSVIKSVDQLVEGIKEVDSLPEKLQESVVGILIITKKLIMLLPDLVVNQGDINLKKKDLMYSLDMMIDTKTIPDNTNKDFFLWWGIFGTQWSIYSAIMANVDESNDQSYFSMN